MPHKNVMMKKNGAAVRMFGRGRAMKIKEIGQLEDVRESVKEDKIWVLLR